ncbi:MAG: Rieske 2Fe-2S domain-containing protein [Dehalococcoidia bacterium]
MTTAPRTDIDRAIRHSPKETPYDRASQGFENYWYPVCGSREVREHPPILRQVLGQPIALMRRQGTAYAITDDCPHRGAPLHRGRLYFPRSSTITCRFHGWTFDVTDGSCVAALTDGVASKVTGSLRLRTYPVEERKGIVWIWMGKGEPVPVEEDIPPLLLRDDTMVRFRYSFNYGNWRYHAENGSAGHFQTLHHDSLPLLFHQWRGAPASWSTYLSEPGQDGEWIIEGSGPRDRQTDYPGLGKWPAKRAWRFFTQRPPRALFGITNTTSMRLPGIIRVRDFPMRGSMYYEWYVPYDENHFVYFQLSAHWPKNPISWLWTNAWYFAWAKRMRKVRFNDQDLEMVRAMTDYADRAGQHGPSKLSGADLFPLKWIDSCNRYARGVGTEVALGGDGVSKAQVAARTAKGGS